MLGVHFNHRETWSTKTQTSKMARNGPLNNPSRAWQKIEQMSGMLPPCLFYSFPISKFSIIICIVLKVPWNVQKRIVFREPTEVSFVMRHNGIWLLFVFVCFQRVSSYVLTASHENWGDGSWVLTAVEQSGPHSQGRCGSWTLAPSLSLGAQGRMASAVESCQLLILQLCII